MTRPTLVTASIPRSGNVYLVSLLSACLDGRGREGGPGAWLCPRGAACCETLPCTQKRWRPLAIVRTHDERLDYRQDAGAVYVVQYREPLGHFLSRAELAAEHDGRFAERDAAYHAWWAATVADYAVGFLERWVLGAGPPRTLLAYESLQGDPAGAVSTVLAATGLNVPAERIAEVVTALSGVRALRAKKTTRDPVYRTRDPGQSTVVPMALAKAYEAHLRARTAFVAWPAALSPLEPDPAFDALVADATRLRTGAPGPAFRAASDNPWAQRSFARRARRDA